MASVSSSERRRTVWALSFQTAHAYLITVSGNVARSAVKIAAALLSISRREASLSSLPAASISLSTSGLA